MYVLFKMFDQTSLTEHIFIEFVVLKTATLQWELPRVRFSGCFKNNYF